MNEPTDKFPGPDEQYAQMIERFSDQSEVFARDLTTYAHVIEAVEDNERRHFLKDVPPGYDEFNTCEFDVAHGFYAGFKVLRDLGADLVILGPNGIEENPKILSTQDINDYAAVRTKDRTATSILIDLYITEHDPVFGLFEFGHQNRVPGSFNNDLAGRLASHQNPKLERLQQSGIIERAQMNDTLAGGLSMLRNPERVAECTSPKLLEEEKEAIAKYDELRKQGIRPLGLEEVYGLMGDTVKDYLARHPDVHLQLMRGSN